MGEHRYTLRTGHRPKNGPPLSLQDAEAMALKNHPQLLASQAAYRRSDQITTENRAAYYPALNGEIAAAQAEQNSRLGAGVLNDPRLFNHFGAGLTLSQLITDSGRTPNLVANAKLNAQAGREDSRATGYDVLLGVNQAYYEVWLAQQLIKVAQQTVATRQSVVDQISELTRNKLRSTVDLSFAQVNLADAQLMTLRARDRLATAYASLGQALGSQQAIVYQLTDQPEPPAPPASADTLVTQAFHNRPELASFEITDGSGPEVCVRGARPEAVHGKRFRSSRRFALDSTRQRQSRYTARIRSRGCKCSGAYFQRPSLLGSPPGRGVSTSRYQSRRAQHAGSGGTGSANRMGSCDNFF